MYSARATRPQMNRASFLIGTVAAYHATTTLAKAIPVSVTPNLASFPPFIHPHTVHSVTPLSTKFNGAALKPIKSLVPSGLVSSDRTADPPKPTIPPQWSAPFTYVTSGIKLGGRSFYQDAINSRYVCTCCDTAILRAPRHAVSRSLFACLCKVRQPNIGIRVR